MFSANVNIKNKLEGDELDLSMSRLTNIPVEDIASIEKATKLDLSNNEIIHIPHNFATCLPHVTKIDLSSNKLRELPNNFGSLINLKHLDLYNNQLTDLPLSVSFLQSLRYLDLKNNPLRVDLAKAAGNCLDNKECQLAAKRIVAHLRHLKKEKDREFTLAAFRDKKESMAKQKQEEEERTRENEKKKLEKKSQKEKRRQEYEDLKRKQLQQQQQQNRPNQSENVQNGNKANRKEFEKRASQNRETRSGWNKNSSDKWSWLGLVNWFLLLAVLVSAIALFTISSEGDFSEKGLRNAWSRSLNNSNILLEIAKETITVENFQWAIENAWKLIGPCAVKVQETLLMGLSATRNLALASFHALQSITGDLSPYFDGLILYWNALKENLCCLASKIDMAFMLEGVVWLFRFMYVQVQVLNEEFWSNEAIVSIWRDLTPLREFLWSNTVTFRYYYWQLCEELTVTWWPTLKQSTLDLYDFGRERIATVLL